MSIDGYSGCGKSSLAKTLARELGYSYIDTGAMYRAVTLYFIRHQVLLTDAKAVAAALANIHIDFAEQRTFLNQEDVEHELRTLTIGQWVSQIAAISDVRRALVAQQRSMGQLGGIVMDGRDIGTVVFPNAELKIFVTANLDVRVARRHRELLALGHNISQDAVRQDLAERDRIDASRSDSPLQQATDAIVLDNSYFTFTEFVAAGLALAHKVLNDR
ncbi:MAG: (d)CMP kinase [Lewinella sp.]|nr:(d)CMP kinase [Lewinella sp.]